MVVGWCIFGTLANVILHGGIARTSGPSNSVPGVHISALLVPLLPHHFLRAGINAGEAFDGLIDCNGRIRRAIDTIVHGATSSHTAPIILAAPLFVVLLHRNGARNMWVGIPTAPGFGPEEAALVGYGSAFGFGWFLHRQTKLPARWQASWHIHLSIGVILTAMCLSIVGPIRKARLRCLPEVASPTLCFTQLRYWF